MIRRYYHKIISLLDHNIMMLKSTNKNTIKYLDNINLFYKIKRIYKSNWIKLSQAKILIYNK
jgi:hypothetical protein